VVRECLTCSLRYYIASYVEVTMGYLDTGKEGGAFMRSVR